MGGLKTDKFWRHWTGIKWYMAGAKRTTGEPCIACTRFPDSLQFTVTLHQEGGGYNSVLLAFSKSIVVRGMETPKDATK